MPDTDPKADDPRPSAAGAPRTPPPPDEPPPNILRDKGVDPDTTRGRDGRREGESSSP